MRLVTIGFESGADLLEHHSTAEGHSALFCRTRAPVRRKDSVILEVSLPGLAQPVRMRGRALSAHAKGFWFSVGDVDRPSLEYLLRIANAGIPDRQDRTHPRFPASLPVACRIDELETDDQARRGMISDVGLGGAFVADLEAPAVGTRVSLTIGPAGDEGHYLTVDGRVAWTDARRGGFGVHFDSRGLDDVMRLRRLVRQATATGHAETLGL